MSDMKGFIKAAQKGAVTVVFKKIYDDEIRTMVCTLNRELSNNNVPEILEQKDVGDNLAVWALDRQAWRSFRTNTVIEWYEGYPKENAA
jgi:hypothetical protein